MASISRSVFEGTANLSVSGIAVRLLSIVTTPILTALLPPAAYGATAYVQTLAAMGAVVALMGIDMAYARYLYQTSGTAPWNSSKACWGKSATNKTVAIATK